MKRLHIYTTALLFALSMASPLAASPLMADLAPQPQPQPQPQSDAGDSEPVSFTDTTDGGSYHAAHESNTALTPGPGSRTARTTVNPNYEEDYSTLTHEDHMNHYDQEQPLSRKRRSEAEESEPPEAEVPCPHHDFNMRTNIPLVADVGNTLVTDYAAVPEEAKMAMRRRRRQAVRLVTDVYIDDKDPFKEDESKAEFMDRLRRNNKMKATCDLDCPKYDFTPVCASKADCNYEFPNMCILKKYQCLYPQAGFMPANPDRCKIPWLTRCDPNDLGNIKQ